jgi:hypothetical protein
MQYTFNIDSIYLKYKDNAVEMQLMKFCVTEKKIRKVSAVDFQ